MATSSNIGYIENGVYHYVYCHFDGYIKDGVGDKLKDYYTTLEEIKEIVKRGNMSSLEDSIETSKFYGENSNNCKLEEFENNSKLHEIYNYFFKDGKWFCYKYGTKFKLKQIN